MKVKFTKLPNGASFITITNYNGTSVTRNRIQADTDLELNNEGLAILNPTILDTPLGRRFKFTLEEIDGPGSDPEVDVSSLEAAHTSIFGFFFNASSSLRGFGAGIQEYPDNQTALDAIGNGGIYRNASNALYVAIGIPTALSPYIELSGDGAYIELSTDPNTAYFQLNNPN